MTIERNRIPVFTGIGILVSIFAMVILIGMMRGKVEPVDPSAARAAERAEALKQLQATNSVQLTQYAVLDAGKDVVRLPIDRAMQILVQEWQNPEAGREQLIARLKRVIPPAPAAPAEAAPRPPEQPSPFE